MEHNKTNKVVFDWLFKNNINAAFATIRLSLGFPVSVRKKVDLNSTSSWEQTDKKISWREAKILNCACPRSIFPVPVPLQVNKQKIGNPPLIINLQLIGQFSAVKCTHVFVMINKTNFQFSIFEFLWLK